MSNATASNTPTRSTRRQHKPRHRRGGKPRTQQNAGAQREISPVVSEPTVSEPTTSAAGEGPLPTFAELGLAKPILDVLDAAGITTPFPIQAATLPDSIAGRDVLGRGQTGSGKTLAFGLAMLSRLAGSRAKPKRPRGLVLVPTRELAMQVADELTPYAKAMGLWCRVAVGGMSFPRQMDALQRGVDLLIATPGRLSDHVRQGTAALSEVTVTAVDEADQMADMGFLPQVRELLDLTDSTSQRLLFSATLDRDVDKLVRAYLHDPVTHSVTPPSASVTTMEHHMLLLNAADKQDVVAEVASREGRTIMFVRTKHNVDRLTKKLRSVGVNAGALHGGKTQGARSKVLAEFRDGSTPVLIATDVAARGIHVDDVGLVVHVDPPADAKGYLHRAGRTARAGQAGTVVTLVTKDQRKAVFSMAESAGVTAQRTSVYPGNAELVRITAARTPSGTPVPEPVHRPAPRQPGRKPVGNDLHGQRQRQGPQQRQGQRGQGGYRGQGRRPRNPSPPNG